MHHDICSCFLLFSSPAWWNILQPLADGSGAKVIVPLCCPPGIWDQEGQGALSKQRWVSLAHMRAHDLRDGKIHTVITFQTYFSQFSHRKSTPSPLQIVCQPLINSSPPAHTHTHRSISLCPRQEVAFARDSFPAVFGFHFCLSADEYLNSCFLVAGFGF